MLEVYKRSFDVNVVVKKRAEKSYLNEVSVIPEARHYSSLEGEYIKYACPICASSGLRHSINKGVTWCPICGIKLCWDVVEEGVFEDDE